MYLWHTTAVLMHTNLTKSPKHLSDLTDHRHTVMPPFCFSVCVYEVWVHACACSQVWAQACPCQSLCVAIWKQLCALVLIFHLVGNCVSCSQRYMPAWLPWQLLRPLLSSSCDVNGSAGITCMPLHWALNGFWGTKALEPLSPFPAPIPFEFSFFPSSLPPSSLPSFGTFILNWAPDQIINHHGSTECHLHVILDKHGLRS